MPPAEISRIHRGDSVRIGETPVGKGVFSERSYPLHAIIGEITGKLVTESANGSQYAFEIDDRTQLEPDAPFRYLNHSCEPNCEFDSFEDDARAWFRGRPAVLDRASRHQLRRRVDDRLQLARELCHSLSMCSGVMSWLDRQSRRVGSPQRELRFLV